MSGTSQKELEPVDSKFRHVNGVKTALTLMGYTKKWFLIRRKWIVVQ